MQSFYSHLPNLSPFHLAAALVSSNDHINEDWDWIDHRKPNDACSKLDLKKALETTVHSGQQPSC